MSCVYRSSSSSLHFEPNQYKLLKTRDAIEITSSSLRIDEFRKHTSLHWKKMNLEAEFSTVLLIFVVNSGPNSFHDEVRIEKSLRRTGFPTKSQS